MASMAALCSDDVLWVSSWIESDGERTIKQRSKKVKHIKLYCSWFCPFAQRAWIALEEKGIDYQYVEINPYEVDNSEPGGYTKKALQLAEKERLYPGFMESSPRGLVPALDDNGHHVWESLPLIEYIDEEYAGPALLPSDPHRRALARIWSNHVSDRMQKPFYTMLMEQDEVKQGAAKDSFLQECRIFARAMSEDGPFFFGNTFSIVDIALAPFWQRFVWVGHNRGLTFPDNDADFDRLRQWWSVVRWRSSVASTVVCAERLIFSYSQYSRNMATSDYARNLSMMSTGLPAAVKCAHSSEPKHKYGSGHGEDIVLAASGKLWYGAWTGVGFLFVGSAVTVYMVNRWAKS